MVRTLKETVESSRDVALKNRYGWVMVGVGALAMVSTLPGRTHGMGMITERLLLDPAFDLTRTGLGYLNLWATLIGAGFCLGIGTLIDRFGLRVAVAIVMIPLSAAVMLMSRVSSIPLLFLAVTMVRGLGQSSLSVVSITIVGKWFPAKPSLPMAVYSVLLTIGFIVVTLVAKEYATFDWRVFWMSVGVGVMIAGLISILLARDPVKGSLDDGKMSRQDESAKEGQREPVDYRLSEALRTPFFFVASGAISLFGMTISGMTLFNESILAERGFEYAVYYDSLAVGAGIGIIANLIAGGLGIHFSVNRLLAIAQLMLVGSLVMLTQVDTYTEVMIHVVFNATGGGMLTVLFFTIWPKLYGKAHLGSIQSTAQMFTVVASALGPLVFAYSKELTGSYNVVIVTLAVLFLVLSAISWFCPLPDRVTKNELTPR